MQIIVVSNQNDSVPILTIKETFIADHIYYNMTFDLTEYLFWIVYSGE